jgi:hypothetical protein
MITQCPGKKSGLLSSNLCNIVENGLFTLYILLGLYIYINILA